MRVTPLLGRSRALLNIALLTAALAALGCNDDDTDSVADGAGGSNPSGGAGGEGGDGDGVPDPLGLDRCESAVGSMSMPVELPVVGSSSTDTLAVSCALRALDAELAQKRILCSGEGNHGVSESTRWHALLTRYLVHRWNVRVIAYEMTGADVEGWNRYLASGDEADLESGFVGSAGTLAGTVEVEDLVRTLRDVQLELPEGERLSLVGFDISVQTKATLDALQAFLTIVEPGDVDAIMTELKTGADEERAAAAGELHARIVRNEAAYVAATDETRWKAARRDAKNLEDGYRFLFHYEQGDFGTGNALYREPGLIRNMEQIAADTPSDQRVVMISHDFHCAKKMPASGAETIDESPTVGTHLALSPTWGPGYFVVGQHYHHGEHLTFSGTADFEAGTTMLESEIANTTESQALLVSTASTWINFKKNWPVMANGVFAGAIVPSKQYDALIWLRETTAATPR
jgi:erythromycin esterase-like protein